MKYFLLILTFVTINTSLSAQNFDKLNKKKLRAVAKQQFKKIDSIKNILSIKENDITNFEVTLREIKNQLLEEKNNVEIKNKYLELIKTENKVISERLTKIDIENKSLKKSLQTTKIKAVNNFLTQFLINEEPIENQQFKFALDKVLIGHKNFNYNDSYNRTKNIKSIPEYISVKDLSFYNIITNKKVVEETTIEDLLELQTVEVLNEAMPSIEIIKNKFVTMTYFNNKKESFLLSFEKEQENNKRKLIQLKLEGEEVENDNNYYSENSKDITLSVFAIDNEAYVALNVNQLKRLVVSIKSVNSINSGGQNKNKQIYKQLIRDKGKTHIDTLKHNSLKYIKRTISRFKEADYNFFEIKTINNNNIFIARKADDFLKKETFLDLKDDLVFLFKLEIAQ